MEIRRATVEDAAAVAELYNPFVLDSLVSFETKPVTAAEMAARISERLQKYTWLVAVDGERLLGYAYYGEFRARAAYNGTAEATVYLAEEAKGRGLGSQLYSALMTQARAQGIRQMIGVITLPNDASEALHRRMGFEPVGVFRAIGRKFDQDADVAFWQLSL